jgi:hypothetical protein
LTKSPLDELARILEERKFKRRTFLAVLLDSLDPISAKSREWFDYETKAVSHEIDVLGEIMPEETPTWRATLEEIKTKFASAFQYIDEVSRKAKKGELKSIRDIYKHPTSKEEAIQLPELIPPTKRQRTPLDAAQSILAIWDAASDLENLVNRVELEALRTLRLRQIVKKEVMKS